MPNLTKTTRDHDEIRRWAEERGGKPAHVKSTESSNDIGILRIDFPGYSGEGSLEEVSWDEFFEKFDQHNLALVYQEETAGGEKSNFNKLVSAETAADTDAGGSGRKKTAKAPKKSPAKKASVKKSAPPPAAKKTSSPATRQAAAKKTAPKKAAKKAAPKKAAKKAVKKGAPKKVAQKAVKKAAPKKAVKKAAKKAVKKAAAKKRR